MAVVAPVVVAESTDLFKNVIMGCTGKIVGNFFKESTLDYNINISHKTGLYITCCVVPVVTEIAPVKLSILPAVLEGVDITDIFP